MENKKDREGEFWTNCKKTVEGIGLPFYGIFILAVLVLISPLKIAEMLGSYIKKKIAKKRCRRH